MHGTHRRSTDDHVEQPSPLHAQESQTSQESQASTFRSSEIDPELVEASSNCNPQLFVVSSRTERPRRRTGGDDEKDDQPEETYPEGGREAWLCVAGSWMALCSALGLMNTIATFQTYIASHQLADYSEGTIGWIFSLYTFMVFFLGIYIGPIFDKHGPRWLIFAGTVCVGASLMLLSVCTRMLLPFSLR